MARHYSPKAFMIEAPNKLLKEYYEREGLNSDIPWQHMSEKDIDFVFRAYENAPEPATVAENAALRMRCSREIAMET